MNAHENLLLQLAEEADEVGQQVSKYLRFGGTHTWEGQKGTPAERVMHEVLDLLTIVHMAQDRGLLPIYTHEHMTMMMEAKEARVNHYMRISIQEGRVT